jgi:polar amino acid transport system substrate-binding protein
MRWLRDLNIRVLSLLILAALAAPRAYAQDARDVAPTGSLRVAVGVGPAPSPFWATRDPASGKLRGVTVELGKAAAEKLGLPLQLVEYPNSGEIAAAADKNAWDISFMPASPERARFVDQGPAYVAYVSGYLVRAGSDIRAVADVDRPGIRVGVIEGTGTARAVAKDVKQASLTSFPRAETAVDAIGRGELDALAMGMEAVKDLSRKLPGTKVLDEVIHSTGVVIVVPKAHAAAGDWAARFIEGAKADGTVRRALDVSGFPQERVAE